MSIDKWIFYIGMFFIVLFFVVKKKHKASKFLLALALLIIFCPMFLPRQFFGKWDSVKMLKNKNISKIILKPSLPEWEVNLTDSIIIVSDKNKINYILNLLKNTDVYFPGHSPTIWETKAILVIENNDSIFLKIQKSANQGTAIYESLNVFRNDELSEYLEKITNFTAPHFSVEYKKSNMEAK
jgi:hypothetical protein